MEAAQAGDSAALMTGVSSEDRGEHKTDSSGVSVEKARPASFFLFFNIFILLAHC